MDAADSVTFLGTGGSRFVIIRQLLASGGIWLSLSGTELLLDPGSGCIVQVARRKMQPETLDAIIVSHRHLDHSGDVNVMVEAMTRGGLQPHGRVFAPSDALGPEPVMFSYLNDNIDGTVVLEEGKSYSIGNVSFKTPVAHVHRVETYGMVFKTPRHTLSYITDTRFFEGLVKHYEADLLIINTVLLKPGPPATIDSLLEEHLSVPDAAYIISTLKPKAAILTHFGVNLWRANPGEVAAQMTRETGIRVIAARDGMKFDLSELDG
jgi:ribonuclease BN (tRNA processing enzyme)